LKSEIIQIDKMNVSEAANSSNSSIAGVSGSPVAPADYLVYFWLAYIVVGAPLTLLDLLSLVLMVRRNSARLGNYFLVGLSFGDLLNSLAMLMSGCWRLKYTLAGESGLLTSRLVCFFKLAFMWVMATQTTAVLLVASGIDRFAINRHKLT